MPFFAQNNDDLPDMPDVKVGDLQKDVKQGWENSRHGR